MSKSPFSSLKPPFLDGIKLEKITEQAEKLLPGDQTKEEMQRSVQVMMQSALSKLDLVTREEFETQQAVLQKTREKAEKLEAKVDELLNDLENRAGDAQT